METTRWRVARSSQQGTKNLKRNMNCQDSNFAVTMPHNSEDTLIAAVADGLGSAPLSGIGARKAAHTAVCKTACSIWEHRGQVKPQHLENILYKAMIEARTAIEQAAEEMQVQINDLATTILLAVHIKGTLATAHIGDGAAIIYSEDQYVTFSKPTRGEYVNQTYALTSRRALQRCHIDIAVPKEPIRNIALTTDGMLDLTISNRTFEPHPGFFDNIFNWLRSHEGKPHWNNELNQMLQSERINQRTDDDKTLVIATR